MTDERPGGRMERNLNMGTRLGMTRVPAERPVVRTIEDALLHGLAQPGQPSELRAWKHDNEEHFVRGLPAWERSVRHGSTAPTGMLWARHLDADGNEVADYGLVSMRVVTQNGVEHIVETWLGTRVLNDMKYHGMGIGAVAEASTDTALGTELTTQYTTPNNRTLATLAKQAYNVLRQTATITTNTVVGVTEWGLFSQLVKNTGTPTGGYMFDRAVFSVMNLGTNESIAFTHDLTLPAGG